MLVGAVLTRWVPDRSLTIMRTLSAYTYYAIRKVNAEAGPVSF